MIAAYRIFKTKHSATWFDGEGSYRFGGRWNSRGTRLLYTSESLSLAVLEMFVNLNSDELLSAYSYVEVRFEESLVLPVSKFRKLPPNWNDQPVPFEIQRIGDAWAERKLSVVLKVPSSVLLSEDNYLINIEHPKFSMIKLGKPTPFVFDKRLYNRK